MKRDKVHYNPVQRANVSVYPVGKSLGIYKGMIIFRNVLDNYVICTVTWRDLVLVNSFVDRKYKGEKKFSTVKSETKAKAADFSCNNINNNNSNSLCLSMK